MEVGFGCFDATLWKRTGDFPLVILKYLKVFISKFHSVDVCCCLWGLFFFFLAWCIFLFFILFSQAWLAGLLSFLFIYFPCFLFQAFPTPPTVFISSGGASDQLYIMLWLDNQTEVQVLILVLYLMAGTACVFCFFSKQSNLEIGKLCEILHC